MALLIKTNAKPCGQGPSPFTKTLNQEYGQSRPHFRKGNYERKTEKTN